MQVASAQHVSKEINNLVYTSVEVAINFCMRAVQPV